MRWGCRKATCPTKAHSSFVRSRCQPCNRRRKTQIHFANRSACGSTSGSAPWAGVETPAGNRRPDAAQSKATVHLALPVARPRQPVPPRPPPCVGASRGFRATRALPRSVRAPVDFKALARRATSEAGARRGKLRKDIRSSPRPEPGIASRRRRVPWNDLTVE
jgi:hypothetical protein